MKNLKKVGKYTKIKTKKRKAILNLRRIPKRKIKLIPSVIKEKPEIFSPHNTSEYLIANNSSSFLSEEDEDIDIDFNPEPFIPFSEKNDLIKMENQNSENKEPSLELELASTAAQSQDFSFRKLSFE
jgi:hypothetical protein